MKRDVVVTGIGICSPIGNGQETFWSNCQRDQTNVAQIPDSWASSGPLSSRIWSPLGALKWGDPLTTRIEDKQLDPVSVIGIHAAGEALSDAGFEKTLVDPKRNSYRLESQDATKVGVYVGTGIGGIHTVGQSHSYQFCSRQAAMLGDLAQTLSERENSDDALDQIAEMKTAMRFPKRFSPFSVSMLMPNACAANVAIKFGAKGPNRTIALACASGTAAVGEGYRAISSGAVDVAIVGGAEYLFDDYGTVFRSFDAPGALVNNYESPDSANRPFDEKRSGFLFSQGGAAFLILESQESANRRDASTICHIEGYAESCDAGSIMMIDPEGVQIERMLRELLTSTETSPKEIDYINAHGTGTLANDAVESNIIAKLFSKQVVVNSTKALVGHTIGAAGALEAAVTALSLRDQKTHGNPNLEESIADLNFQRQAGEISCNKAISQSFGFGGHNTALLMSR